MQKSERILLLIVFIVVAGVGGAAGLRAWQLSRQAMLMRAKNPPVALSIPIVEVVGTNAIYQGEIRSPYTLVEFMDYECPPCKHAFGVLAKILQKNQKLKLTVRHFPLPIHAHVREAALAAESARIHGCFWPVHEALMQAPKVNEEVIHNILTAQHLDERTVLASYVIASSKVKADELMAERLNLTGTPSFVLCCPNGKVFRLGRLDQIDDLVH